LYPDKYITEGNKVVFVAADDTDFRFLEALISKHRYYDSFGVWTAEKDLDKLITASIVKGLLAKNCVELGCFSGPVLSILKESGIDVCGIEISHLAFVIAHQNIYQHLVYGDILTHPDDKQYDVFLAMDVLEHLSPLDINPVISKIARLIKPTGFAIINSPMYGLDRIFGEVFSPYLGEWQDKKDSTYWRNLHCDDKGWPMHGHLIWASPEWWERSFAKQGLIRDVEIECTLQDLLSGFFSRHAPARKSLFILRHKDFIPDIHLIQETLHKLILDDLSKY
jgi:SAM-dependent methyltransferase